MDVAFVPDGLAMTGPAPVDDGAVVSSIRELAAVGVTWVTVALPGGTRDAQLGAIEHFGRAVIDRLH